MNDISYIVVDGLKYQCNFDIKNNMIYTSIENGDFKCFSEKIKTKETYIITSDLDSSKYQCKINNIIFMTVHVNDHGFFHTTTIDMSFSDYEIIKIKKKIIKNKKRRVKFLNGL